MKDFFLEIADLLNEKAPLILSAKETLLQVQIAYSQSQKRNLDDLIDDQLAIFSAGKNILDDVSHIYTNPGQILTQLFLFLKQSQSIERFLQWAL